MKLDHQADRYYNLLLDSFHKLSPTPKLIKMDALRKLHEGLGYQNVITYVQGGNVILTQ